MSASASVMEQRRDLLDRLGDLIYRLLVTAAMTDAPAPVYTTIAAEAKRQGLCASTGAVKEAMDALMREGRIARVGRTNHSGYDLPGIGLRTRSSCQPSGSMNPRAERTVLRCPTLDERAEMFGGERPYAVGEVVPVRSRYVTANPYLEDHGWTSPLAEL